MPILPPRRPCHRDIRQDGDCLRPARLVLPGMGSVPGIGGGAGGVPSSTPLCWQPARLWCAATSPMLAPCCPWRPMTGSSCRAARTGPLSSLTDGAMGSFRGCRWVLLPPKTRGGTRDRLGDSLLHHCCSWGPEIWGAAGSAPANASFLPPSWKTTCSQCRTRGRSSGQGTTRAECTSSGTALVASSPPG